VEGGGVGERAQGVRVRNVRVRKESDTVRRTLKCD
jgi:hypothetical protein